MDNDRQFRNWECVKALYEWRKALWRDQMLADLATRAVAKPYGVDVRLVAFCIADQGTNGFGCFPSVERIADYIGCSPRTVKTWRKRLIELGWFAVADRAGGTNHRSLVLHIAIPSEGEKDEQGRQAA